ncbi:hypothetical protein G6F37_012802 [Rhizopus arrhizus]|nr:hypothetical protein G6F38_012792 [Rhizopus arrhizus]KAG1141500.1 hypothetical protein G6F37_012802 [Rhizopus arrhizus]
MVEFINGVIVKSLKKIAYEHKEDWDVLLPSVLYAYRTKAHSILKLSPYELLFGVEPFDVDKDVLQQYGRRIGLERLAYLQQRNGLQNFMVDYDNENGITQAENTKINVGDKILLLKRNRKNKLDPKYRRKLYTVLVKKANNVLILANDKDIRLKRAVNGSQVRKYYHRNN